MNLNNFDGLRRYTPTLKDRITTNDILGSLIALGLTVGGALYLYDSNNRTQALLASGNAGPRCGHVARGDGIQSVLIKQLELYSKEHFVSQREAMNLISAAGKLQQRYESGHGSVQGKAKVCITRLKDGVPHGVTVNGVLVTEPQAK